MRVKTALITLRCDDCEAVHPEFQFRPQSFDRLAAGPELRTAIEAGQSPQAIWNSWSGDLARFRETRAQYLIY